MISSERRCSSSERTRPSSSVSENMRIWASGVRSSWDTPDTKSVRRRASSYSRCSWTNAVTISPVVSASTPSSTGSRERGRPPITSFDAISGRSATWTCIPPIIASTVSRAENVAGYCTGERSEEHTSELQSLTNLVCRLLLEKKKKKYTLRLKSMYHFQHTKILRLSLSTTQRIFFYNITHRTSEP